MGERGRGVANRKGEGGRGGGKPWWRGVEVANRVGEGVVAHRGREGAGGGKPYWRGGGCKPCGRKEEEVANRGLGTGNHTSTGSTDFHDFHVSLREFFDFHDFLALQVEL